MKLGNVITCAAIGLLLIASGLLGSPSNAAAAAGSSAVAAAHADLLALQSQVAHSASIAFDTNIEVQGDPSTASQVSGTFQRPGKFRVTVSAGSANILELASDGTKLTAYSPKSGRYYVSETAKDFPEPVNQTYLQFLSSEIGQAQASSVIMFLALLSQSNFAPPTTAPVQGESLKSTASEETSTLNGQPVNEIRARSTIALPTGESGSILVQIVYTKSPLSVKSYAVTISQTGRPTTELIKMACKTFDASATPVDNSVFSYAPPSAAKLALDSDIASAAAIGTALPPGSVAPDFTVQTPNGAKVKLSDYTGKVVVVDCWATWCGPCQASLPQTDKIARKYAPEGVVFLPVCVSDTKANFTEWLPKHSDLTMNFFFDPAGRDSPGFSSTLYHVDGIPTQFVIGKDGKVAATFVGYDESGDPNESALTTAIDKAMAM